MREPAFEVDNIVALRAIDAGRMPANSEVRVRGYYAAGDGGGGAFYFDATSSAADDGGIVIQPNAGSGRWRRADRGAVNVRWFGARGDDDEKVYSADYLVSSYHVAQQTADGLAINRALGYLRAAGGGQLHFPAGTYRIFATLETIDFSCEITGEGRAATRLKNCASSPANANGHGLVWFRGAGPTRRTATVRALTLDGSTDERGPHAEKVNYPLAFTGRYEVHLSDLAVINSPIDCLLVDLDPAGSSLDCENAVFDYAYRNSCSIVNGSNLQFARCDFTRGGRPGSTGTNPRACLDIENEAFTGPGTELKNLRFRDCRFESATGIYMVTVEWAQARFDNCEFTAHPSLNGDRLLGSLDSVTELHNCRFKGAAGRGNWIDEEPVRTANRGATLEQRLVVDGCYFDGCALTSYGKDTILKSSTFINCTRGIVIDKSNDGAGVFPHALTVENVEVINCIDVHNASGYSSFLTGQGVTGPIRIDGLVVGFDASRLAPAMPSLAPDIDAAAGLRLQSTPAAIRSRFGFDVVHAVANVYCFGYYTDLPAHIGRPPGPGFRDWGNYQPAPPDSPGDGPAPTDAQPYFKHCAAKGPTP